MTRETAAATMSLIISYKEVVASESILGTYKARATYYLRRR